MNDKTFYTFLIISGVVLTFFLLVTFLFSLLKIYMDIHISSHGLFALFLGCFFSADDPVSERPSKSGCYISYTMDMHVESADHVISIYNRVSHIQGVITL